MARKCCTDIWWLRSPSLDGQVAGKYPGKVWGTNTTPGAVAYQGVWFNDCGARPALYLKSAFFKAYKDDSGIRYWTNDEDAAGYTPVVYFKATADHDWDEGKVTKQPTDTAEGVKTYTYKTCVKAYVMENGQKKCINKSPTIHTFTGNNLCQPAMHQNSGT